MEKDNVKRGIPGRPDLVQFNQEGAYLSEGDMGRKMVIAAREP